MNTIKIAIYDESPAETIQTTTLLMNYDRFSTFSLTTFSNPAALLTSDHAYDIVILEIGGQEPNGYEIARRLQQSACRPLIFFLTNDPGYVYESYGLAYRYLLKPVSQEQIDQALNEAIKELFANRCLVEYGNTTYLLRPWDIYYIETSGHYVTVHTKDERIEFRGQYKRILKQLPQGYFAIPHKGYVVNLEFVRSVSTETITLLDQTVIPISRRSHVAFRKKLREFQHCRRLWSAHVLR